MGYNSRTADRRDIEKSMWERAWNFCALSRHAILPVPPRVHPLGSSPNPFFLGFYGGSITQTWLIKPLAIGYWFNVQPPSLPLRWGGGENGKGWGETESSSALIMVGSPGNQFPFLVDSQKSPHWHKLRCIERVFLWIYQDMPFIFWLWAISGTYDKDQIL